MNCISCSFYGITCLIVLVLVTGRDFVSVRDFSVTLTSVMPSSCTLIDITDDSAPEDTECFTVSLTMNAQQSGTVQLARDEATVCIIDNDGMFMVHIYSCHQKV